MPKLKRVLPYNGLDSKSSYLLLINPDKIPHLVFIQNNSYYSLTYKESEINKPFQNYFRKLRRLNKKMIFIELRVVSADVNQEFQKYISANSTNLTCFVPIKNILLPESNSEMIHELIPELYDNQIIEKVYQLNADSDLSSEGEFPLQVYTKKMIFSYIEHLKNKDASRN